MTNPDFVGFRHVPGPSGPVPHQSGTESHGGRSGGRDRGRGRWRYLTLPETPRSTQSVCLVPPGPNRCCLTPDKRREVTITGD